VTCPEDNTLGALVEGRLGEAETAEIREHLDGCEACRGAALAAVRAGLARAPTDTEDEPDAAPAVGATYGRYELRRLIGTGGMGHVFEAFDRELERAVALKLVRPQVADQRAAERLVRESRIMAKVADRSVITVFDAGRLGARVYIAMELIRGDTLGSYLARTRPGWREVVALYARAGAGLVAAHRAGVVHRDFKPDNVLVELASDRVRRVVVTDFGIAHAGEPAEPAGEPTPRETASGDVRLTATGAAIGTPAYMAPEQLSGEPVDARADMFAFAVALWEGLFGARPFAGRTVEAIHAAQLVRPRPPRGAPRVPARLVRVVERGLAIAPADRWPDLSTMLQRLAAIRARRRRVAIAASAALLVGLGVAGARIASAPASACGRELEAPALGTALDPVLAARVARFAGDWRTVHSEACRAARAPALACLEARRLELAAFADDVRTGGARTAQALAATLGDPAACRDPAPGLLEPRVPSDPVVRRAVTPLRVTIHDASTARERGELEVAARLAKAAADDARAGWPEVRAEALYELALVQDARGEHKPAVAGLREAASVAAAARDDELVARSWLQLVASASYELDEPARVLEYVATADAALDRIGRPTELVIQLELVKGGALLDADRFDDGERLLRHAVELAEARAPDQLSEADQALAESYVTRGRYDDAAAAYRRALARASADRATAVVLHDRLALVLEMAGHEAESETEARTAVQLAGALPAHDAARADAQLTLANVLDTLGHSADALIEVRAAERDLAASVGERNARYADALRIEAAILESLDRLPDANAAYARACDIVAFEIGSGTTQQAECWHERSSVLAKLGKREPALALLDDAVPLLTTAYGERHPQVAIALTDRGILEADLARHERAVADLSRAIEVLQHVAVAPGYLGAAEWVLGRELAATDLPRARALITDAIPKLDSSSPNWTAMRRDARAWLAAHPQK